MLVPVVQFFNTLPDKCCHKCGAAIVEQADCYQTVCDRCDGVQFYHVHGERKDQGGHAVGTSVIRIAD